MKKTKVYQAPSLRVITCSQQATLLGASGTGVESNRSGYGAATEQTWGESD